MSELALCLVEDAVAVGAGRAAPMGTARDYTVAALEFAASRAKPGEHPTDALLRLILDGHAIVETLYACAERANDKDNQ